MTPLRPTDAPGADYAYPAEVRLTQGDRELQAEAITLLRREPGPAMAMIGANSPIAVDDLCLALRRWAGQEALLGRVREATAPRSAKEWSAVDTLVVATTPDGLDPLQTEAMRRWLAGGGRIWLLLDRIDASWPVELLSDAWDIAVLDDMPIERWSLRYDDVAIDVTLDDPAWLRRIWPGSFEVLATAKGEPAVMRKAVGAGEVWVTTLTAEGWHAAAAVEGQASALEVLAPITRVEQAGVNFTAMERTARRDIGYEIVGLGPVLAVLAVHGGAILGVGLWLRWRRRLGLIWVASVTGSMVGCVILLIVGLNRQQQTPPSVSQSQIIQAVHPLGLSHVSGVVSVYRPAILSFAPEPVIHGSDGEDIWPLDDIGGATLLRYLTLDPLRWRLQGLDLPHGATRSLTVQAVDRETVPRVSATLDDSGLTGRIAGIEASRFELPLLATAGGRQAVTVADAAWRSDADAAIDADATAGGGLLTERENRLREAYDAWFANAGSFDRPTLLGWSEPLSVGVHYLPDARERGLALHVSPIQLERPPSGAVVFVPSTLMTRRPSRLPGQASATIYDPRRQTFLPDVSSPATVVMSYRPPAEFGHIKPTAAELQLDMSTPGRAWEVVAVVDKKLRPIASGRDANGPIRVALSPAALERDEHGEYAVGLSVAASANPRSQRGWTIHRMDLELQGVVE